MPILARLRGIACMATRRPFATGLMLSSKMPSKRRTATKINQRRRNRANSPMRNSSMTMVLMGTRRKKEIVRGKFKEEALAR